VLLLAGSALFAACSSSDSPVSPFEARAIPQEFAGDVASVVAGNNAFAFDLYHVFRTDDGNLFFSPFSISTALAMTYAGAAGQTELEMAEVLHFTLGREALHPAYGALLESVDRGNALPNYTLETANRLWTATTYTFQEEFLNTTREDYGAEAARTDFAADPEGARTRINDWVAARTHERISDLFPAGTITTQTALVLANAIYLQGSWETRFDPAATRSETFFVSPDREVTVPLMHGRPKALFGHTDGVYFLELPYSGEDLSMELLLPERKDGLAALETALSEETLSRWRDHASEQEPEVYLPRFSFRWKNRLAATLTALGMPSAFDPMRADFSRMTGHRNLKIDRVLHQAFVTVNEEGTEAAAATGGGFGPTSVPDQFRADHPFVFLIRDRVTGAVLFLGRVIDPGASA